MEEVNDISKDELVDEIKHLISVDGTSTHINPSYLEYFELEELQDIRDNLIYKKVHHDEISKDFLDELFEKCSDL
ncbi:MAG: hypothetical protein U9Q20_05285 [Campylobacterota bacterium]|nr:hypothetical protein [Campylobacterota bacterium]